MRTTVEQARARAWSVREKTTMVMMTMVRQHVSPACIVGSMYRQHVSQPFLDGCGGANHTPVSPGRRRRQTFSPYTFGSVQPYIEQE